jgi:citrate synthase
MSTTNVAKGLEGLVVAETHLSKVESEGKLSYCGYSISDLAQNASFEEVVFLLWNYRLPTRAELKEFSDSTRGCMEIPRLIFQHMQAYVPESHPMAALRTAVSALAMTESAPDETNPENIHLHACQMLGSFPAIVAGWHRVRTGHYPIEAREDLGHAANFLWMLNGIEPDPLDVRSLDMYLILLADHGFNASTFSSRVTISTLSDMFSAITSAIGTLKGVAHGGANEAAMNVFMEIGEVENVEPWFRRAREEGRRIMGIGHRVYKAMDPRATELHKMAVAQAEKKGGEVAKYFNIAEKLVELTRQDPYFVERNLYPNVDYYSAIVLHALGIPTDLFTPMFAISRVAGWSAHILEQWKDNRLIRPRASYVGGMGLPWVPLDERTN